MNQLDSNRFNTFGNETDRNTINSSHRARKPPSVQKYSSEPTSHRDTSAQTVNEGNHQKQEFITCHTEVSDTSQVGPSDDLDLKENIIKGMPDASDEGRAFNTLELKQFSEIEKSLENTFKTAYSKLTSGEINLKEDFKNTLSLMFPCDYFAPGSFGSTAVCNKTILEVSESEIGKSPRKQDMARMISEIAKKQIGARKMDADLYSERAREFVRNSVQRLGKEELGSLESQSNRTKATDSSERNTSNPSDKAYLMNEFQSLKKEVDAIQKDLKVSEDYNKKLETHIYNQSCQIMQILYNFNSINEENGMLKQQLAGLLKKSSVKETERLNQKVEAGKYDHIDHVIAKKHNKFLLEEISQVKTRYEKIIRNHESIINDLQMQLKAKDNELQGLEKQNRQDNEARTLSELILCQPKRSVTDSKKSDHELQSLREAHGLDIKRSGFYTPNRMRPLNELKPSNSHEKHYDVKTTKSTRNLADISSSGSFNYHKQAREFIKDLQKSKIRDKENIPRDLQAGGKPSDKKAPLAKGGSLVQSNYQIEQISSKAREKSGSGNKTHKERKESLGAYDKGYNYGQSHKEREKVLQISQDGESPFDEDSKKSLADISFEISYLKENIDKRLDSELNSMNISPLKEKENRNKPPQKQKSKNIQNNSQFNEISIINEQLSENFITDSIHTKIISELQSHPDSNKKVLPDDFEATYGKVVKEYGSSRNKAEEHLEKRNSHGGMTPKDYPASHLDYGKGREHYSSSRRDTNATAKENVEVYQVSHSRRSAKAGEEKATDQYKRSKSSEKAVKARALQGHRLPSDVSEERKTHKEESALEKGYREYLKELAEKSKKNSENHTHTTHDKSRQAQSRSKERGSHHERHHQTEKHGPNDTLVTLNMALEKMLEKDQDKGNHKTVKSKGGRPEENEKHEALQELDDVQLEYRSRSSGHKQKKSTPTVMGSNLQLVGSNPSFKPASSSRAEAPEISLRKTHDKNYERIYEGEYHLPSGTATNKNSKRQFYGLKEDLNQFNNSDCDITGSQPACSSKTRLDSSKGGQGKSTTPTGSYNKLQVSNMKNSSEGISQAIPGRDSSKGSRKSYQNIEPVPKTLNSFEHSSGRPSSVTQTRSGSGNIKDNKYTCNSTKYQMGPYNDISIVDYKYTDEVRNEDVRYQHSTNDFVNFDSVLHQEKEGNGAIYKSNNSSFVLFQDKFSNLNFDSINSSSVFEAFPVKKSINTKDGNKVYGVHNMKFMKHI